MKFGKPKILVPYLADQMFQFIVENDKHNQKLLDEVRAAGHDVQAFSFEFLCLRVFSIVAAASNALPRALHEQFLDYLFLSVQRYTESLGFKEVMMQTSSGGEMMPLCDWVAERVFTYVAIAEQWPQQHVQKISARFSEFCGGSSSDAVLIDIAKSTFVLFGNIALKWFKSVRASPSI